MCFVLSCFVSYTPSFCCACRQQVSCQRSSCERALLHTAAHGSEMAFGMTISVCPLCRQSAVRMRIHTASQSISFSVWRRAPNCFCSLIQPSHLSALSRVRAAQWAEPLKPVHQSQTRTLSHIREPHADQPDRTTKVQFPISALFSHWKSYTAGKADFNLRMHFCRTENNFYNSSCFYE